MEGRAGSCYYDIPPLCENSSPPLPPILPPNLAVVGLYESMLTCVLDHEGASGDEVVRLDTPPPVAGVEGPQPGDGKQMEGPAHWQHSRKPPTCTSGGNTAIP